MQACLSDTCYRPDKQKGRLSFFFCMLALIMGGLGICKCRVKFFLQDVSKNSLPPHPLKNLFLLKEILQDKGSRNKRIKEQNLHLFLKFVFTYCSTETAEFLASVSLDSDLTVSDILEALLSRKSSKCENGILAAPQFQDFTAMW